MTRRQKSNTGQPRRSSSRNSDASNGASTSQNGKDGKSQRKWYRADMHLHSPASHDYEQPEATYLDWLRRAAEQELDIVAVTDHNTVAGIGAIRDEIEQLTWLEERKRLTDDEKKRLEEWRELSEKVLVLPGFEFTATFGFHILGIFPPETPVRQLEHVLLQLNVPPEKLDVGSTETGASTDVLTTYKVIRDAGGLAIAAHANSSHGVAMRDFPFGGQTKIAYTQDQYLDALEVTDLEKRSRSTKRFFSGIKAEYPRRMHCIQGSDAHRLVPEEDKPAKSSRGRGKSAKSPARDRPQKNKRLGIGDRATDLLLEEPTFEAIAELLRSTNFDRTRPARPKDHPFDPLEAARDEGPSLDLSFYETATSRGGRLTAILSDVCAFANTAGGTIYVGASHRSIKPKGLTDIKATEKEIMETIADRVAPSIDVKMDTITSQDVQVLRLHVPKGSDRPYCLDDYKFYIRDDSETNLAVRDEIVALVSEVLAETQRGSNNRSGRSNNNSNNDRSRNSSTNNRQQPNGRQKSDDDQRSRRSRSSNSGGGDTSNNGQAPAPQSKVSKDDAFYLPQVGVEIVETLERNGRNVHSVRDLRNGRIIKNVTRKGARKLWSYAIGQHEDNPITTKKVQWKGDAGLVDVETRAGKQRYNLALRESGSIRVFYGVTEDGMEGRWSSFIQDE